MMEAVLKSNFTYEEKQKRVTTLFEENKSHIKELDQLEIERTNLKTEARVLENNRQLIMEYRWVLGGISGSGVFLAVVGFLNWSTMEENELRQAGSISKSQLKL
jgi:hypothetical protein